MKFYGLKWSKDSTLDEKGFDKMGIKPFNNLKKNFEINKTFQSFPSCNISGSVKRPKKLIESTY